MKNKIFKLLIFNICILFIQISVCLSQQERDTKTGYYLYKFENNLKYCSKDLGFSWKLCEFKIFRLTPTGKQISYDLGATWHTYEVSINKLNCTFNTRNNSLQLPKLENTAYYINIVDINGYTILTKNIEPGITELTLDGLKIGTYYVKVIQNKILFNGNFVVNY